MSTPGGGRPKKLKAERRRHRLVVKVNDAELRGIEKRAEQADLPRATYMRRASLHRKTTRKLDDEAWRKLRHIGLELQRLTAAAETERHSLIAKKLRALTSEVRRIMQAL